MEDDSAYRKLWHVWAAVRSGDFRVLCTRHCCNPTRVLNAKKLSAISSAACISFPLVQTAVSPSLGATCNPDPIHHGESRPSSQRSCGARVAEYCEPPRHKSWQHTPAGSMAKRARHARCKPVFVFFHSVAFVRQQPPGAGNPSRGQRSIHELGSKPRREEASVMVSRCRAKGGVAAKLTDAIP
jgi:hypothetical protein